MGVPTRPPGSAAHRAETNINARASVRLRSPAALHGARYAAWRRAAPWQKALDTVRTAVTSNEQESLSAARVEPRVGDGALVRAPGDRRVKGDTAGECRLHRRPPITRVVRTQGMFHVKHPTPLPRQADVHPAPHATERQNEQAGSERCRWPLRRRLPPMCHPCAPGHTGASLAHNEPL
jgi:hypothetical protein